MYVLVILVFQGLQVRHFLECCCLVLFRVVDKGASEKDVLPQIGQVDETLFILFITDVVPPTRPSVWGH